MRLAGCARTRGEDHLEVVVRVCLHHLDVVQDVLRLDLAQQYLEAAVRCEEVLALPRSFSGRVALAVYRSQAFAVIYSLGVMSLLVLSGLEDKAHWHVAVLSLCALDMCLGVAASTFTQYFKRPWHVALGISMIVLLINNLCM